MWPSLIWRSLTPPSKLGKGSGIIDSSDWNVLIAQCCVIFCLRIMYIRLLRSHLVPLTATTLVCVNSNARLNLKLCNLIGLQLLLPAHKSMMLDPFPEFRGWGQATPDYSARSGVARVMLMVGMPGRYIQCDNWCLPPVGIHTYNYTRTDTRLPTRAHGASRICK